MSRVHGHLRPNPDPMCIAEISYKKSPIVHLTIHLAPKTLLPLQHGMIHLVKNHYQNKSKYGRLKDAARIRLLAARSIDKPNSLIFKIMDGLAPPAKGNISLESIIQQELLVLLAVINMIFDENDRKHYIGNLKLPESELLNMNTSGIPPIRNANPKTPSIVSQLNKIGIAITRQNKGVPYIIHTLDASLAPSSSSTPTTHMAAHHPLRRSMRKKKYERRKTLHKSK